MECSWNEGGEEEPGHQKNRQVQALPGMGKQRETNYSLENLFPVGFQTEGFFSRTLLKISTYVSACLFQLGVYRLKYPRLLYSVMSVQERRGRVPARLRCLLTKRPSFR